MASITSLTSSSSSSTSSLYGSRNVLSGLASGMDTESMIENSIAGYKTKIQNLQNMQTKLTWKQDAYRSITDKLIALSSKYTSYTSKTNLTSNSFFNKAVKTTTNGTNASKVSATGKTSSDVQLNAVQQLATAASYKMDAKDLLGTDSLTGGEITWDKMTTVSDVTGSMTIKVGGDSNNTSIDLSFTEADLETLNNSVSSGKSNVQAMADLINSKLESTDVSGKTGSAYLTAEVSGDTITLTASEETKQKGDGVWISAASGSIVDTLGVTTSSSMPTGDDAVASRTLTVSDDKPFSHQVTMAEKLSGSSINVTLDGTTKTITLGDMKDENGDYLAGNALRDKVIADLKKGLSDNFGSKVTVDLTDNKLSFKAASSTSSLKISSSAGSSLGMSGDLTSYLNTGKKLSDLLGAGMGGMTANDDGTYDMTVNGVKVGSFTENDSLESVMSAINNSSAGVKVSYSQLTNKFTFTANETGEESKIEFDNNLKKLFGDPSAADANYSKGQDAIVNVTVNGDNLTLTRSSNQVSIDGLSVTLKGTFNENLTADELKNVSKDDAVTFTTSADADTIVDAVKSFVEQINDILTSTHEAYNTTPNKTTNYSSYEPLSDDDKSSMTETQIAAYEEKAKAGILFGDRDLSGLYSALRTAISGSGMDVGTLRDIGLTTSYSNGVTSLDLDEDKLREALAADPDKVRDIFTKTKENGASSDGLMASVSKVLDKYASTSIGNYGVLVKKAGTKTKSLTLTDNNLQKQIDSYEKQIESWQTKMSNKIDYYTNQFSTLEQLINTMNSQSSALSGLMGG